MAKSGRNQVPRTRLAWLFALPLILMPLQAPKNSQCELTFTLQGQGRMALDPASGQITAIQPVPGVLSPDGRSWIIQHNSGGHLTLVLHSNSHENSPEIVLNPPGTDGLAAAWSPAGDLIAFSAADNGNHSIYVARSDGSGIAKLTGPGAQVAADNTIPMQDDFPAWSPDGTLIAFRSNRSGGDGLWLIKSDGTGLKQIASYGGQPVWSRNGQYVAWQTPPNRIGVVDLANGKLSGLGGGTVARANPMWSPDSLWLGYLEGGIIEGPNTDQSRGMPFAVYKMHPDDTERTRVTPADLPVSEARWASDADVIAFTSAGKLYLISSDGSNLQPITIASATATANQVSALAWVCIPAAATPVATSATTTQASSTAAVTP